MEGERERGGGETPAGLTRSLARAAVLRCPRCGSRGIVRGWISVGPRCPGCGLRADRGEGDHFLGAMALNLVVAELVTAGAVLALLLATWPDPPWGLLTWGGAALAALMPLVFYPFSKLLWLALDRRFRPGRPDGGRGGRPDARTTA